MVDTIWISGRISNIPWNYHRISIQLLDTSRFPEFLRGAKADLGLDGHKGDVGPGSGHDPKLGVSMGINGNLVGGLVNMNFIFPIYWVANHPN